MTKPSRSLEKAVLKWLDCRREWMGFATADHQHASGERDRIVLNMSKAETLLEAEAAKLKESAEAA
jgi:hypothetical protein